MKKRMLLGVLLLSAIMGCGIIGNYQNIYFYPTNSSNANEFMKGTVYNLSGKIRITSTNGDEYLGELVKVLRPQDPTDSFYAVELGFPKIWDTIYGDQYYSKNVMGLERYWRCTLTSSSNKPLYIEAIRPDAHSDKRFGVAVDTKGHAYKVIF